MELQTCPIFTTCWQQYNNVKFTPLFPFYNPLLHEISFIIDCQYFIDDWNAHDTMRCILICYYDHQNTVILNKHTNVVEFREMNVFKYPWCLWEKNFASADVRLAKIPNVVKSDRHTLSKPLRPESHLNRRWHVSYTICLIELFTDKYVYIVL